MALTKYVAQRPPNSQKAISSYLDAEFRKIQRTSDTVIDTTTSIEEALAVAQDDIDALEADVAALAAGPWIAPTLLNSWVRYDTGSLPNAWPTLEYRKDPFGLVTLRGLIKNGTTTTGTNIAVLPAGYRPGSHTMHKCLSWTGSSYQLVRVDVYSNGNITLIDPIFSGGSIGNTWFSVESIQFIAEL